METTQPQIEIYMNFRHADTRLRTLRRQILWMLQYRHCSVVLIGHRRTFENAPQVLRDYVVDATYRGVAAISWQRGANEKPEYVSGGWCSEFENIGKECPEI